MNENTVVEAIKFANDPVLKFFGVFFPLNQYVTKAA